MNNYEVMQAKQLQNSIEAILFWKAEPVSAKKLGELLGASEESVAEAAGELKEALSSRGVTLLEKDGQYEIRTGTNASELIEKIQKDELVKDLGKAGLETLAIVLYEGPVSRREIDHVRGVNSAFILRNLQIRGLIEKIPHPKDQRSFLYRGTIDLLGHLGISSIKDLPEYDSVRNELEIFKQSVEETKNEEESKEASV